MGWNRNANASPLNLERRIRSPQKMLHAPLLVLLIVIPQGSAVAVAVLITYTRTVISTGGGAFAAAVERPPHFALALILFPKNTSKKACQAPKLRKP
jgi:hypothetical protein